MQAAIEELPALTYLIQEQRKQTGKLFDLSTIDGQQIRSWLKEMNRQGEVKADSPASVHQALRELNAQVERLRESLTLPHKAVPKAGTSSIAGTLTEEGAGTPLGFELIRLFDASGNLLAIDFTDSDGSYLFGGLIAGTYFVKAEAEDHFDELYDDIPCPITCDTTTGTPIVVTADTATSGIDFVLGLGGRIRGAVTEEGTGTPLGFELIRLFDASGNLLAIDFTDSDGSYLFGGLIAGTYFVKAEADDHFDELYDNIPCEDSCDETTGTPVIVTEGGTASGIDFALFSGLPLFADGFESGDTSAWSSVAP